MVNRLGIAPVGGERVGLLEPAARRDGVGCPLQLGTGPRRRRRLTTPLPRAVAQPLIDEPQQGSGQHRQYRPQQDAGIGRVRQQAVEPAEEMADRLQYLVEPLEKVTQPRRGLHRSQLELDRTVVAQGLVSGSEALVRARCLLLCG